MKHYIQHATAMKEEKWLVKVGKAESSIMILVLYKSSDLNARAYLPLRVHIYFPGVMVKNQDITCDF